MSPEVYVGHNAVDPQGNKIGTVGQVYLNDQTGHPDWITVNPGLCSMKENFAPLRVPFQRRRRGAAVRQGRRQALPDIADSADLDIDEQDSLYAYYRPYLGAGTAADEQDTTVRGAAGYQQPNHRRGGQDTSARAPTTR
jgi:hypothetical protein